MCSCNEDYDLDSDGKTCLLKCGTTLNEANGTIRVPTLSEATPIECTWRIVLEESYDYILLEGNVPHEQFCNTSYIFVSNSTTDCKEYPQRIATTTSTTITFSFRNFS